MRPRRPTRPRAPRPDAEERPLHPSWTIRRAKLLRPRLAPHLIDRHQLIEQLNAARERPIVLVVGPAGAGKTTLLCQWLAQIDRPAAWVTLDEDDNHLSSFARHLLGAIHTIAPDIGDLALSGLFSARQPPAGVLGGLLLDDLVSLTTDIVVVLDDFQVIQSPSIQAFLAPLIRYPVPHLQLVISSRIDPILHLAKARARQEVVELRPGDLLFSPEESRRFLTDATGSELNEEQLTLLVAHNEGWAAGLQFAALAVSGGGDVAALVQAIAGRGERHGQEFLLEEVFAQQPEEVQRFLLRTSVVDRLTPSLCDALAAGPDTTPNAAAMLDELVARNLFLVPLGDEGEWYRYHHLFRTLLRRQLVRLHGKDEAQRLAAVARVWFEDQGLIDEAIRYALAADDPVAASAIVRRHAQSALASGAWPLLERWLDDLPDAMIDGDPELLMLAALCDRLRGRTGVAGRRLRMARANMEAAEAVGPNGAALRAELDALDIFVGDLFDPSLSVETLMQAVSALPPDHLYFLAQAHLRIGLLRAASGDVDGAIQGLMEVLAETGESPTVLTYRVAAGVIWCHFIGGQFDAAHTMVDRLTHLASADDTNAEALIWTRWLAAALAHERADYAQEVVLLETLFAARPVIEHRIFFDARIMLAAAYRAMGWWDKSRTALEDLLTLAEATANREVMDWCQSWLCVHDAQRGNWRSAFQWVDRVGNDISSGDAVFVPPVEHNLVRLLIARGRDADLARARSVIDRLRRTYDVGRIWPRRLVQLCAMEALLHERRGDQDAADAEIQRALALISPGGFRRTLTEFTPDITPLLERAPASAAREWLLASPAQALTEEGTRRPGRATSTERAPGSSADPQELLSGREREVLELVQQRLSNKEIADLLFISPLTVKRHTTNIYDKLGVHSRWRAVRRAGELGLLPQTEEFARVRTGESARAPSV